MQFPQVFRVLLSALTLVVVHACGDDHDHSHDHRSVHQKRLFPQTELPVPTRPLEWGDFNIIHTTDTHGWFSYISLRFRLRSVANVGWLLGHQHTSFPEPNYSGDLGDFSSFVQHMKQIALVRTDSLHSAAD